MPKAGFAQFLSYLDPTVAPSLHHHQFLPPWRTSLLLEFHLHRDSKQTRLIQRNEIAPTHRQRDHSLLAVPPYLAQKRLGRDREHGVPASEGRVEETQHVIHCPGDTYVCAWLLELIDTSCQFGVMRYIDFPSYRLSYLSATR